MVRLVYLPTCERSLRLLANELLATVCVSGTPAAREVDAVRIRSIIISLINFTQFCGVVCYSDFMYVIMPSHRRSVHPNRTFIQSADIKYLGRYIIESS